MVLELELALASALALVLILILLLLLVFEFDLELELELCSCAFSFMRSNHPDIVGKREVVVSALRGVRSVCFEGLRRSLLLERV